MSGQSLLNIVGFLLFAACGAVLAQVVLANGEFGRVLKTVRPDLYRPDLHKFGFSGSLSEYWALYFTPQQNPALERARERIVKGVKWWGILMGMWMLYMLSQLIFMLTQGPPAY